MPSAKRMFHLFAAVWWVIRPESENMPPTRKATDSTKKKTLSGEVTIKGMRRFSKTKKFTTRDVGCMSQAEGMLQKEKTPGPEPQPASPNAAEA